MVLMLALWFLVLDISVCRSIVRPKTGQHQPEQSLYPSKWVEAQQAFVQPKVFGPERCRRWLNSTQTELHLLVDEQSVYPSLQDKGPGDAHACIVRAAVRNVTAFPRPVREKEPWIFHRDGLIFSIRSCPIDS